MAGLHHVELWVASVEEIRDQWRWLLTQMGFVRQAEWSTGESWGAGGAYLTLTTSPNASASVHDRRRPGMNHLAFSVATAEQVHAVMASATAHGWRPLYAERYPYAGGPEHYAGWLENTARYKVEIVAESVSRG